jgi:hypothetical protein
MRGVGQVACMRVMSNTYKMVVRKRKVKITQRKSTHNWEDNIKMDLKEI